MWPMLLVRTQSFGNITHIVISKRLMKVLDLVTKKENYIIKRNSFWFFVFLLFKFSLFRKKIFKKANRQRTHTTT